VKPNSIRRGICRCTDSLLADERVESLNGIPLLTADPDVEIIANAKILPRIHGVLNDLSVPIPIICTPEEMVEDDSRN
jgi:hypothetical protein